MICQACGGTGEEREGYGYSFAAECPVCKGTGKVYQPPRQEERRDGTFPPGWDDEDGYGAYDG